MPRLEEGGIPIVPRSSDEKSTYELAERNSQQVSDLLNTNRSDGNTFLINCIAVLDFLDSRDPEILNYLGMHTNPDEETAKSIYKVFRSRLRNRNADGFFIIPNAQIYDLIQSQAIHEEAGELHKVDVIKRLFARICSHADGTRSISSFGSRNDFEDIPFIVSQEEAEVVSTYTLMDQKEWPTIGVVMREYIRRYEIFMQQRGM